MTEQKKSLSRPLSPHLGIYRWQYTNGLSILHRLTGLVLTVGSIVLVYWLVATASGPQAYASAQKVFDNVVIKILLMAWIFCFCYHFLNGIRHLIWDSGRGFELKIARQSGYTVAVGAIVMTALLAFLFFAYGSGGAQ